MSIESKYLRCSMKLQPSQLVLNSFGLCSAVFCFSGLCLNLYPSASGALRERARQHLRARCFSPSLLLSDMSSFRVCRPCSGLREMEALPECQSAPFCPGESHNTHTRTHTHKLLMGNYSVAALFYGKTWFPSRLLTLTCGLSEKI